MRLKNVLIALACLSAARVRADVVLNSFESVSATGYTVWTRGANGGLCSLKPCGINGPCATVFQDAAFATDGTRSGKVWLQGEDGGSGDLEDCAANNCSTNPLLRTLQLASFSPHDWSTGFLRVQFDARKHSPSDPLEVDIQFKDGTQTIGPLAFNLNANDAWNTFSVNIQDLANAGLNVANVTEVDLIVGGASPQACTTVYLDNLRLQGGTPPCAPVSVSAVATGVSGQIQVSWSEVCAPTFPITGYCVYRASYAFVNPLNAQVTTCNLAGSPLTVNGLTDGKPYWFKVVAIDSAGNASPAGDVGSLDMASPYCGTPAPANSAVGWAQAVRVIWSPVGGATTYRIYKSTYNPATCQDRGPLRVALPGASVYFDDFNVTIGNTYCYVVTADAGGCESACSNAACSLFNGAGTPPCLPPGPVPNFTVTPGQGNMTLNWDQPVAGGSPLFKYEVWRATFSGAFATKTQVGTVFDTGASSYAHVDPSLAPVKNYCYMIRAVDSGGCTNFSPEQCATTLCNLNPPGAQAAQGYCDRVRISWASISTTLYRVYKAPNPASCVALQNPGNLVASFPSASVYFDDFAVTNGQTYDYAVTAWSPTCESACGGAVSALFQTTDPCPPAPPCTPPGVIGLPTGTAGTRQVVIHWNRPVTGGTPISRYFVWEGVGATGGLSGKSITATVWDQPGGPVFTATFTGLAQDTTHCFIVEVADDGNPSCTNFSAEACFTTACVPPAPVGPVALSAVAPDALAVTWSAALPGELPVTRYDVYRTTVPGGAALLAGSVFSTGAATFTFTHTGLGNPLDYCYQVRAVDTGGCTSWSGIACHACNPPGPVAPLAVSAVAPSSLVVTWTSPALGEVAMSRYTVYRATVAGGAQAVLGTVFDTGPGSYSFTNTGLTLTRDYCYTIRAIDGVGCTSFSPETCHPGCALPPASPPPPVVAAQPPNSLLVTWGKAAPGELAVSRYIVYQSTGAGGTGAQAGTVYDDGISAIFSFTATGVTLTATWCFTVEAVDGAGCVAWSAQTCHSCVPPGPVPPVALTAIAATQLAVMWSRPVPGETALSVYFIYRATVAGGPQVNVATVYDDGVATAYTFTHTGLALINTYCYQVNGVDRSGCSNWSVESCYMCQPPVWTGLTCGGTPTYACLLPVTQTSTVISLTWDAALAGATDNPVSYYRVFRSTDPACGGAAQIGTVIALPVTATAFTYVDQGVIPANNYYYEVVAVSRNGCVVNSECASTGTPGACQFASGPVATVLPGPTATPMVRLDWTSLVTGTIQKFEVWRGGSATGGQAGKTRIASLAGTVSAYVDSTVAPGQSYCYVVTMDVVPACTVVSAETCASPPTLAFTAYPNPAKLSEGGVRFDGLDPEAAIELYTLTGELVRRATSASGGLWIWDGKNDDGSIVASGIYLYIVRNKKATIKGKLVVAR